CWHYIDRAPSSRADSSLPAPAPRGRLTPMNKHLRTACVLLSAFLFGQPATLALREERSPTREQVLAGLRSFFAKTALPDGSYQAGIDPDYPGMADTAYSDLAAVTYAIVLHRTFGWKLPNEEKTRQFILARQGKDGAFF